VRLVHWLVTAPLALVLVIFAVSNREEVTVTFWPLPVVLAAPLYLVVLLSLLAGFLVGALVAWVGGARTRREARARLRRIEALERELAATQAQLPASPVAPRIPAPAAPQPYAGSR
jgi:uncharacterized integral membrane protein